MSKDQREISSNTTMTTMEKGLALSKVAEALYGERKEELCLECIQVAQTILTDHSSPYPPEQKEDHMNLQKKLTKLARHCHIELEDMEEIQQPAKTLQDPTEMDKLESEILSQPFSHVESSEPNVDFSHEEHSEPNEENPPREENAIEPIHCLVDRPESHGITQTIPENTFVIPDFNEISDELSIPPQDVEVAYAIEMSIQEHNVISHNTPMDSLKRFREEYHQYKTEDVLRHERIAQKMRRTDSFDEKLEDHEFGPDSQNLSQNVSESGEEQEEKKNQMPL
jgi:hypothetical protein